MSLPVNLFRPIPPSFPNGYCPATWQNLVNDLVGGMQITMLIQSGTFVYNLGSTTPAPENRIYPWLNTATGLWYSFQYGYWTSPRPVREQDPEYNWIWTPVAGTLESVLWFKDGGDGTDPSVSGNVKAFTGSFWKVNHDLDGRIPIGAGDVPGSDPALTIPVGTTNGEAQHTLILKEMPYHGHGMPDPVSPAVTIPVGTFQAGAEWRDNDTPIYKKGQFAYEGGDPANGNVTVAHNNMQPSRSVFFVQPTTRIWYTLPP